MFLSPNILGPLGLQPDAIDFQGTWVGTGTINPGSCVMLDTQQGTATTYQSGASTSIFASLQVPNESGDLYQQYQYCIFAIYIGRPDGVSTGISQGARGIFRLTGNCRALIENDDNDTDAPAGSCLWVGGDRQLHCNAESGMVANLQKCLGWLNEDSAFADDLTLRNVTFNGLGIGMVYTSA